MHRTFLVLALLVAVFTVGCGAPAAPAPPSLNLPVPVQNLTAARVGNSVHLAWTMPTKTTDRVTLKRPVTVQICRAMQDGHCADIASVVLPPGAAGAYTDELPSGLAQGAVRLLRYEIALRNHAGKAAGSSNAAYTAAGPAPAAVTGLVAQVRSDGVLLSWQPVAQPIPVFFRIDRLQLTAPAPSETPKSPLAAPRNRLPSRRCRFRRRRVTILVTPSMPPPFLANATATWSNDSSPAPSPVMR